MQGLGFGTTATPHIELHMDRMRLARLMEYREGKNPEGILLEDLVVETIFQVVVSADIICQFEKVEEEYRNGERTNVHYLGGAKTPQPEYQWFEPDITLVHPI